MKKNLVILLSSLICINSLGGPKEIYRKLIKNSTGNYLPLKNHRTYKTKKKYSVKVTAEVKQKKTSLEKKLTLEIYDANTRIIFLDKNADGLGPGDELYLINKFSNDDELKMIFKYLKKDKYLILDEFSKKESNKKVIYGRDIIDTSSSKLKFLNFITFGYVRRKINPIVNFSNKTYTDLIWSIENEKEFKIPYLDFKKIMKNLEPKLKKIKTGKIKTGKVMEDLTDDFLKILKK